MAVEKIQTSLYFIGYYVRVKNISFDKICGENRVRNFQRWTLNTGGTNLSKALQLLKIYITYNEE